MRATQPTYNADFDVGMPTSAALQRWRLNVRGTQPSFSIGSPRFTSCSGQTPAALPIYGYATIHSTPTSPRSIAQEAIGPSSSRLVRKLPMAYRRTRAINGVSTHKPSTSALQAGPFDRDLETSSLKNVGQLLSARLAAITHTTSNPQTSSALDLGHKAFLERQELKSSSQLDSPIVLLTREREGWTVSPKMDQASRPALRRLSHSTVASSISGTTCKTERSKTKKKPSADAWDEEDEEIDKGRVRKLKGFRSIRRATITSHKSKKSQEDIVTPPPLPLTIPNFDTISHRNHLYPSSYKANSSTLVRDSLQSAQIAQQWKLGNRHSTTDMKQTSRPHLRDQSMTSTGLSAVTVKHLKSSQRPGTAPVSDRSPPLPFGKRPSTAQRMKQSFRPSSRSSSASHEGLSDYTSHNAQRNPSMSLIEEVKTNGDLSCEGRGSPLLLHVNGQMSLEPLNTDRSPDSRARLGNSSFSTIAAKRASQHVKVMEMRNAMHDLQVALEDGEEELEYTGEVIQVTPSPLSSCSLSTKASSLSEEATPVTSASRPASIMPGNALGNALTSGLHAWTAKERSVSGGQHDCFRKSVSEISLRQSVSSSSHPLLADIHEDVTTSTDACSRRSLAKVTTTKESSERPPTSTFSASSSSEYDESSNQGSESHRSSMRTCNEGQTALDAPIAADNLDVLSAEGNQLRPIEDPRDAVQDEEILQSSSESCTSDKSNSLDESETGSIQAARKMGLIQLRVEAMAGRASSELDPKSPYQVLLSPTPLQSKSAVADTSITSQDVGSADVSFPSIDSLGSHMGMLLLTEKGVQTELGSEEKAPFDNTTRTVRHIDHSLRFPVFEPGLEAHVEINWLGREGCGEMKLEYVNLLRGTLLLSLNDMARIAGEYNRIRAQHRSSQRSARSKDSEEAAHTINSLEDSERRKIDDEILAQRQQDIIATSRSRPSSVPALRSVEVACEDAKRSEGMQETTLSRQTSRPRLLLLSTSLERHVKEAGHEELQTQRRPPSLQNCRSDEERIVDRLPTVDRSLLSKQNKLDVPPPLPPRRRRPSPLPAAPFGHTSVQYIRSPELQALRIHPELARRTA